MYKFVGASLVVFEGLDATGKTTQADIFKGWDDVLVEHQPSGAPGIGHDIYALTEKAEGLDSTARQLLHLACHAQHYRDVILPGIASGKAVVLDRFWWSTVAYGYFDGKVGNESHPPRMYPEDFIALTRLPTKGIMPSVLFLFDKPYAEDAHNTPALAEAYNWLSIKFTAGLFGADPHQPTFPIVNIPILDERETHLYIISQLLKLGLIEGTPYAMEETAHESV